MKRPSFSQFSLRARILTLLIALGATTVGGALATIWYADTVNELFSTVIERDVTSFHIADDLATALTMQKGYATYFFQNGNKKWLKDLDHFQKIFEENLGKAREQGHSKEAWRTLSKIETLYSQYKGERAQVIQLYQAGTPGKREAGIQLQSRIRPRFLSLIALCEQFKEIHRKQMAQAQKKAQMATRYINAGALIAIQVSALLFFLLAYILFRHILGPIRQLTWETGPKGDPALLSDEVEVLSDRVHSLIDDVDQTQNQLARSQEHLVQSEKWALTGKLAAGVAHSIRNPLTSVKIRLFSLERALGLTPALKEDLGVISEEIHHIESIVRNFLEFSRPPKLTMQKISPSDVVDTALRLLQPRMDSERVQLELVREKRLGEIWADPDQLKEVLVNLLINASEVLGEGGLIGITEKEEESGAGGHKAIISISDNGPGIPEAIQENIFQPFFSTKEEGTGLGLSIASRIVEKHGGSLTLISQEGSGATFVITLPYEDKSSESAVRGSE
jgi:signal transduction histidine kinase